MTIQFIVIGTKARSGRRDPDETLQIGTNKGVWNIFSEYYTWLISLSKKYSPLNSLASTD